MKPRAAFALVAVLFCATAGQAQQQRVVRVTPGFATVIMCPAEPELVTIGDSQSFTVQNSGRFLLVKPVTRAGSTNMFIKSAGESFHLILQVSERPDLEVRLASATPPAPVAGPPAGSTTTAGSGSNGGDQASSEVRLTARKSLGQVLQTARSVLPPYLRTPRRYTYSVKESGVVLALDYMVQIEDKLFVLCTIVNNSNIPYDIGYVRFKLIDVAPSFIFFSKKIKETELEPIREAYQANVKPKSSSRLLFIFEKHGFTDNSRLEIKCIEESGHRDLTLEVPGSYVE